MKLLILVAGLLLSVNAAMADVSPSLYCVSTKTYKSADSWPVNQFNIFTNDKGTVRMSLQFHAWGQSEEEDATITTDTLLTLQKVGFDEASQSLQNKSGKFVLNLGKEISAEEAEAILNAKEVSFSFEDPAGMLVKFNKYRLATLTSFEYPGKKEQWSEVLKKAFDSGVNEYVCGDIRDAVRP